MLPIFAGRTSLPLFKAGSDERSSGGIARIAPDVAVAGYETGYSDLLHLVALRHTDFGPQVGPELTFATSPGITRILDLVEGRDGEVWMLTERNYFVSTRELLHLWRITVDLATLTLTATQYALPPAQTYNWGGTLTTWPEENLVAIVANGGKYGSDTSYATGTYIWLYLVDMDDPGVVIAETQGPPLEPEIRNWGERLHAISINRTASRVLIAGQRSYAAGTDGYSYYRPTTWAAGISRAGFGPWEHLADLPVANNVSGYYSGNIDAYLSWAAAVETPGGWNVLHGDTQWESQIMRWVAISSVGELAEGAPLTQAGVTSIEDDGYSKPFDLGRDHDLNQTFACFKEYSPTQGLFFAQKVDGEDVIEETSPLPGTAGKVGYVYLTRAACVGPGKYIYLGAGPGLGRPTKISKAGPAVWVGGPTVISSAAASTQAEPTRAAMRRVL